MPNTYGVCSLLPRISSCIRLACRLSFGQKVFARKGTVLIEEGSENSALFVVGSQAALEDFFSIFIWKYETLRMGLLAPAMALSPEVTAILPFPSTVRRSRRLDRDR